MESRDGGSKEDSDPAHLVRMATRMARRWCESPSDAEDVAQDAIVLLLRQASQPLNVASWLYVVTRRLAHRQHLRSRARLDAEHEYGCGRRSTPGDRDATLEAKRILARLAWRDRRLLGFVLEGALSREIAAAFGCQVRDVGQMVSRARRKAQRIRDGGRHKPPHSKLLPD